MAETRAPSLIARTIDYILGRNTLIGIASFMLLIIAGYATWHGMRDFIVGVSSTTTSQGQILPGGMSFSTDLLVIVVVVALTFLMWLMLRETFGAGPPLARTADHLPALCVPRHLVDRLRLRLLVEPDRRRGGDAHGPRRPAGRCARRQRRHRRPPRRGERPDRQRRHLVGRPDVARGDRAAAAAASRRVRAAVRSTMRGAACAIPSPRCATA